MMSYLVAAGSPGMPVRRMALVVISLAVIVLIGAEIAARLIGLHTPVLYETTSYGYRVKPDQELRRFGNRVLINAQGLRSEPISPLPAPGVLRVLCIGDSITNGGAITDQDDTYPYQLQRLLAASGISVEVLNASAPGWAIANAAGWLREHGTFGSRMVLLSIGTHDLYQGAAPAELVGRHPSFRNQAPRTALEELVMHYILRRLLNPVDEDIGATYTAERPATLTLAALEQIMAISEQSRRQQAHLAVLFVEQPSGQEPVDSRTVSDKAMLAEALHAQGIQFANTRGMVEQFGGSALFRDGLHPNVDGNRILARVAASLVAPRLADGLKK